MGHLRRYYHRRIAHIDDSEKNRTTCIRGAYGYLDFGYTYRLGLDRLRCAIYSNGLDLCGGVEKMNTAIYDTIKQFTDAALGQDFAATSKYIAGGLTVAIIVLLVYAIYKMVRLILGK